MKNLAKVFIGLVSIIVIVIAGIWEKNYMDKRALEKDYQQGMELVQSYVTDYLVNNYEGIEKIEWQGVGVEWRNSPIYGPSIMGNYVNSEVKVFISDKRYFAMNFNLNTETYYDINKKKYILQDSMNSKNMDVEILSGQQNAIHELDIQNEGINAFQNIKKSDVGSYKAKIVYNLKIYEFKY